MGSALINRCEEHFQLLQKSPESLTILLFGDWTAATTLPKPHILFEELKNRQVQKICFDTNSLGEWNTSLLIFVLQIKEFCKPLEMQVDLSTLPPGVESLLRLAETSPKASGRMVPRKKNMLVSCYELLRNFLATFLEVLAFTGRMAVCLQQFLKGSARYRKVDFYINIQEAGVNALPIIVLIAFLVGLILAYIGAEQLASFGAEVFIADVVAIGMLREMGPMMTAVIMAGRTGAAFAAQLGTMKVNQEIDAFKTMAISPYQFLVFPRVVSLVAMMPLLTVFANVVGILGGWFVAVTVADVPNQKYWMQALSSVGLSDLYVSLIKAAVFGLIVAMFGCYRGIQSGDDAAAVGNATTSAVVNALVVIVVADALLTITASVLGM